MKWAKRQIKGFLDNSPRRPYIPDACRAIDGIAIYPPHEDDWKNYSIVAPIAVEWEAGEGERMRKILEGEGKNMSKRVAKKPSNMFIWPWALQTEGGCHLAVAIIAPTPRFETAIIMQPSAQQYSKVMLDTIERHINPKLTNVVLDNAWPEGTKAILYLLTIIEEALRTKNKPNQKPILLERLQHTFSKTCEHVMRQYQKPDNQEKFDPQCKTPRSTGDLSLPSQT